jgi:hypothetical protein
VPFRRVLRQGRLQRLGRGRGENQLQVTAVLLGDLVDIGLVRPGGHQQLGVAALGAVRLLPEGADRQQLAVGGEAARDGHLGAGQAPGYQGGERGRDGQADAPGVLRGQVRGDVAVRLADVQVVAREPAGLQVRCELRRLVLYVGRGRRRVALDELVQLALDHH